MGAFTQDNVLSICWGNLQNIHSNSVPEIPKLFLWRLQNAFAVGPTAITNKTCNNCFALKARLWSPVQHALCSSYNELQFAFSVYHLLVNSLQNETKMLTEIVSKLVSGWVIKCCTLF